MLDGLAFTSNLQSVPFPCDSQGKKDLEQLVKSCSGIITVTSLVDEVVHNHQTSLREAIDFANLHPDQNLTILMRPGTYHLTRTGSEENNNLTGDLDIGNRMGKLTILSPPGRAIQNNPDKLTGLSPDKPLVTIDATGLGDRVLDILGGDVTLIGLKLVGGSNVYYGGGIENQGNLTLMNVTISDCSAYDGGGIRNTGSLSLKKSTISDNTASNNGGGIVNNFSGSNMIENSIISGNKCSSYGGGILSEGGVLSLTDSTVSGNTAGGGGGGIMDNNSTVNLTHSKVVDNHANDGGGFQNYYGRVTLEDSTVSRNTAAGGGGGITNLGNSDYRGSMTLINSAISNNTASNNAGGIYNSASCILTVQDSIITYNIADSDNNGTGKGGGIFNAGLLTLLGMNTILNNQPDNIFPI